ncbi:deoxyribose-phosphate aldolase [Pectinophora gossypiella]|uniref:deoxyribose-phosphate aldolase n=1 Tax=Pectinophora gossypiella TaxID=13191 RepID=UPI00214E3227|nr:deoxyribose-phosphate aldolase [Pectinophora gossypiella]
MVRAHPASFDPAVLKNVYINKHNVDEQVKNILINNQVWSKENSFPWLVKAVTVIDLTTLAGDDTKSNVTRLCLKAASPLAPELVKRLGLPEGKVKTAAVCVYPSRVPDAYNALKRLGLVDEIQIASVATGFPSGLYPLKTRIHEIEYCVKNGANEIDVVLDRSLVLTGQWNVLFDEVLQMRKACGDAHLKVILGVGELGTYENVYKASMVSMLAGADFIKTSTGKEAVNATLPIGLVMCRAIRNFYQMTGIKIGLKPAGGIKSAQDAINWLVLVRSELGPEWLSPTLFRIGASSLLDVLEQELDKTAPPIKQ